MPQLSKDRLHGTLDTLVLKTLAWGPRHGYAIARWLEGMGAEVLKIEEGSLYPALYRLERRGWIEAEWGLSETRRKVKLYRLTDAGRPRRRPRAVRRPGAHRRVVRDDRRDARPRAAPRARDRRAAAGRPHRRPAA